VPKPQVVCNRVFAWTNATGVDLARTYDLVANGKDGLSIIDIEKPEQPVLYQMFNAEGRLDDARDVVVGSTNASLFAYVADGKNGMKVLQLTAPDTQPKFYGFSPEPKPHMIAWRKTKSAALTLAKGLDRDRAADETGGQIAVFGRIGSRPLSAEEMRKFYLNPDGTPWFVSDEVTPSAIAAGKKAGASKLNSALSESRCCFASYWAAMFLHRTRHRFPTTRKTLPSVSSIAPTVCATAPLPSGKIPTYCKTNTSPGRALTNTHAPTIFC